MNRIDGYRRGHIAILRALRAGFFLIEHVPTGKLSITGHDTKIPREMFVILRNDDLIEALPEHPDDEPECDYYTLSGAGGDILAELDVAAGM